MTRMNSTIAAQTAREIRRKLKSVNLAPGAIRSKTYSGGNSITITFTDASPSAIKEIHQICQPYIMGHFDAMNDSYVYDNHPGHDGLQVKFLHVNNNMSPQMSQQIDTFGRQRFRYYEPNRDRHRLFTGSLPHFWDQRQAEAPTQA